jgi:hypothetical protein
MFKLTKLITAADGADRSQIEAALNGAAKASGVVRSMLNPTLPNVYNGGDYIWHLQFNDEDAYRHWLADGAGGKAADALVGDPSLVKLAESAAYQGGRTGTKPDAPAKGCYRTLFLSVNQAPSEAAIEKFDRETYMMGVYIHTIKNWQVSRVKDASGTRPWTHIWEQEYEDLSGLMGAYMLHPHHWGHIDRWYDPECTDYMIDTFLCHTFCNFDGSVIAPKR